MGTKKQKALSLRFSLQEIRYVREVKQAKENPKGQVRYELRMKDYLAMALKENSIQDISCLGN